MTTDADLIARMVSDLRELAARRRIDSGRYAIEPRYQEAISGVLDALAAADRREMEATTREASATTIMLAALVFLPVPGVGHNVQQLRRDIDKWILAPSAASLRYQRLLDVAEAARSFVTALYDWADKGGWPGDKCRVLREAIAALDQPPQEPG